MPQAGEQPGEVGDLEWCQGQRLAMGKGQCKLTGSRGQIGEIATGLPSTNATALQCGTTFLWHLKIWTTEKSCCPSIAGGVHLQGGILCIIPHCYRRA